jgi:hypothetical protein
VPSSRIPLLALVGNPCSRIERSIYRRSYGYLSDFLLVGSIGA